MTYHQTGICFCYYGKGRDFSRSVLRQMAQNAPSPQCDVNQNDYLEQNSLERK